MADTPVASEHVEGQLKYAVTAQPAVQMHENSVTTASEAVVGSTDNGCCTWCFAAQGVQATAARTVKKREPPPDVAPHIDALLDGNWGDCGLTQRTNTNGDTLLHLSAIQDNHSTAIAWLIREGANPNSPNATGKTAIELAAAAGMTSNCRALCTSNIQRTPLNNSLILGINNDNLRTTQVLLQEGAVLEDKELARLTSNSTRSFVQTYMRSLSQGGTPGDAQVNTLFWRVPS
jgi:hypothetical protein